MSIAEQLMQRGRQEGHQEGRQEGERAGVARGTMIGRIQAYQEMLGVSISSLEELGAKDTPGLDTLLREIQARVRLRGPGSPE